MPIKTDLVYGKELKVGSVFIPNGETAMFYKITSTTVSKPGKHGSAKTVFTAKEEATGKLLTGTFKETDERILQVLDFDFRYAAINAITDTALTIGSENPSEILLAAFELDSQYRLKKALADKALQDGDAVLSIKYTELEDSKDQNLFFWDLFYSTPDELAKLNR
jgi:hypothetical protein